jgi:hypothetical protein
MKKFKNEIEAHEALLEDYYITRFWQISFCEDQVFKKFMQLQWFPETLYL